MYKNATYRWGFTWREDPTEKSELCTSGGHVNRNKTDEGRMGNH